MNALEKIVSDTFHVMYYFGNVWNGGQTKWLGVGVLQNPLDLFGLQEVIWETKPDVIIETGSAAGGSALFFVSTFPKLKVISIDTQELCKPEVKHERITFIKGKSTDPSVLTKVKKGIKKLRVMIILDSDHSEGNVIKEMESYSSLVTPGCYMIVCDTNLGGNPVWNMTVPGAGPMGAVQKFIKKNDEFEIDQVRGEKFYMSFFPNGWLRKKV